MCIYISKYRMWRSLNLVVTFLYTYTYMHIRYSCKWWFDTYIYIYVLKYQYIIFTQRMVWYTYIYVYMSIYHIHAKSGLTWIPYWDRHICMCGIPLTWLIFECECLAYDTWCYDTWCYDTWRYDAWCYDTWCVICETCFIHMHLITHLCMKWGKQT